MTTVDAAALAVIGIGGSVDTTTASSAPLHDRYTDESSNANRDQHHNLSEKVARRSTSFRGSFLAWNGSEDRCINGPRIVR